MTNFKQLGKSTVRLILYVPKKQVKDNLYKNTCGSQSIRNGSVINVDIMSYRKGS